jgi:integration host factor subunit alpha
MAFTNSHLIDAIAEQNGFTKKQSTETVETILEIIKSSHAAGEDVQVSGFGKFCVKEKRERRGRNPATGEDMMLTPRRLVTFIWAMRLESISSEVRMKNCKINKGMDYLMKKLYQALKNSIICNPDDNERSH